MAITWSSFEGTNGTGPVTQINTGVGFAEGDVSGTRYVNIEPFDGTTVQFSNTSPFKGSTCFRGGSGTREMNYHYQSVNTGTVRGYVKLTAAPSDDFLLAMNWGATWTIFSGIGISTDRKPYAIGYASSSTRKGAGTVGNSEGAANSIPLNQWIRYEMQYTPTTFRGKIWWTDPQSIGTPDFDSGLVTHGTIDGSGGNGGMFTGICTFQASPAGGYACIGSGNFAYIDAIAHSPNTMSWLNPVGGGTAGGLTEISWEGYSAAQVIGGNPVNAGLFRGGLSAHCLDTSSDFLQKTFWQVQTSDAKIGTKASTVTYGASAAVYTNLSEIGTTFHTRAYYKLTAAVANDTSFSDLMAAGFTKSHQAGVKANRAFFVSGGRNDVFTTDAGGGTNWASASNSMPLNAWFRVETKVTATTIQMKVWTTDPDSNGAPDFDSGVITTSSVGAFDDYRFGAQSYVSGTGWSHILASGQTLKMDEMAISDTDWIGAASSGTESRTITAAVTAGTTVVGSASSPGTGDATVTGAVTATAIVNAYTEGSAFYPASTKIHPRPVNEDAPWDAIKGGPVSIRSIAPEVEAISNDLRAAKDEGTGFGSMTLAIRGVWAQISSLASSVVQRSNHTGTQLAATISDFNTAVRANRLDQMATPTADVAFGGRKLTGLANPTAGTDAVNKNYADSLTGGTARVWDVKTYGAVGDGSTDDTAAINAAIAALNANTYGGVLYFPAGDYKVIGSTTPITKRCTIRGDGRSEWYSVSESVSKVSTTSTNSTLFEFAARSCSIENITLHNKNYSPAALSVSPGLGGFPVPLPTALVGSLPTAGCGLKVTVGDGFYLHNVMIAGFYDNLDQVSGVNVIIESLQSWAPVRYGHRIRNEAWVDAGGTNIDKSFYFGNPKYSQGTRGIQWESGGGMWVTSSAFSGMGAPGGGGSQQTGMAYGIYSDFQTGAGSSNLQVSGMGCEGVEVGVYATKASTSSFFHIQINDIQFSPYSTTSGSNTCGVRLIGSATNPIIDVRVSGVFTQYPGNAGSAVDLTYVNNAVLDLQRGTNGPTDANLIKRSNCNNVISQALPANTNTPGLVPTLTGSKSDVLRGDGQITKTTTQTAFINGSNRLPIQVATIPTVAVTTGATTITGYDVPANDTRLRYFGSPVENVGNYQSLGYTNCMRQQLSTYPLRGGTYTIGDFIEVEVETDTNAIEFTVITTAGNGDPLQARYQVHENDEWINAHAQILSGTPNTVHRIKITWASAKNRRVRLMLQGALMAQVKVPYTYTIWSSQRYAGLRAVCQSDSFGYDYSNEGGGASIFGHWSLYNRALKMMGMNVHNDVVSGSGFVNNQSGTVQTFQARFAASVVPLNPDVVTVAGSVNDAGYSLGTVQTAVNSYFANARALLPNATIYGIGGIVPGSQYRSAMESIEGYIQTACANYGCTFVKATDFTNGTGDFGTPIGNGNSDRYASADRYHLTQAGYSYAAERLAATIGTDLMRRAAIR